MIGILSALEQPVSNIAVCWRLARLDGVVLGFTSHDRDIRLCDVTYRARPGMTPSAVVQTDGLEGDSMSVDGVLDAAAVTAHDLSAGRWLGALVEVLVCDWTAPDAGVLYLSRGRTGDVQRPCVDGRGMFRVELLSDVDLSHELLPLRLSPTCRNELGDSACGVNMDGRRMDWALAEGGGFRLMLRPGLGNTQRFAMGSIRFLRGALSGIDRRIVAVEGDQLVLDADVPSGDLRDVLVRLTPGCDKRLGTCQQTFGNSRMFGGEPHVPGTDALIRYARA
jgi:uncharacterized phage protein (TIGR02218 family)